MPKPRTLVVKHAAQLVTSTGKEARRGKAMGYLTNLPDGALAASDGMLVWVGPTPDLPTTFRDEVFIDASGKIILPGLVDSHTHLLFAGSREDEFEQRLQGMTYQEIAACGGGINATVGRVRAGQHNDIVLAGKVINGYEQSSSVCRGSAPIEFSIDTSFCAYSPLALQRDGQ